MDSIWKQLEESSSKAEIVIGSSLRSSEVSKVKQALKSGRALPFVAWLSLIPSLIGIIAFENPDLHVLSWIPCLAGAAVFLATFFKGIVLVRKEETALNHLRVELRNQLRRFNVTVPGGFFEQLVDFVIEGELNSSHRFLDKDSSTYLLRIEDDGSVGLVLLHRSTPAVIKDGVRDSVTQLLGMKSTQKVQLTENSVYKSLPISVVNSAQKIESLLSEVSEFHLELSTEQVYAVEHTEQELLDVLRSYVKLSRLKGGNAGYADTLVILERLEQDVVKLRSQITAEVERDLTVQRIYFENREES